MKIIIASGIMGIVIFYINPVGLFSLFLTILSGLGMYALIIFLLKVFDNQEISFFQVHIYEIINNFVCQN